MTSLPAYSWAQLQQIAESPAFPPAPDSRDPNGPPTAQSNLRLFGAKREDVRVTLYRDFHSWCPYCQKVWLFLEEHRIPYETKRVTMFCYGQKESWYKKIVPSGMLPAISLDGQIVTESDDILTALEAAFGPLGHSMLDPAVIKLRRLERELFYAWCDWLCRPARSAGHDKAAGDQFESVVLDVEKALAANSGPFFMGDEFTVADTVFVPYVERMNASLYYYTGYRLRDPASHPRLAAWFDALESRPAYRAIQSDFHTHAHDLPPQMGGCYENGTEGQKEAKKRVDHGPWGEGIPEIKASVPEDGTAHIEALRRVIKHRENIMKANREGGKEEVDVALRAALTSLVGRWASDVPEKIPLPANGDSILRYIRDRVSVPRDMSVLAGRVFRSALEETASKLGTGQGHPISLRDRRDQDPRGFTAAI